MNAHVRRLMSGGEALERLLAYPDVNRILDIGSGAGLHADLMRAAGKQVVTISLEPPADYVEDYLTARIPASFDAIWASHVLEHQTNVGQFLARCFQDLRGDGILAVTVPPMKHEIVGGHLTLWNTGLLLYNLIIAGFDCREARVSPNYANGSDLPPYNLSVIVRKKRARLPRLRFDRGDIETLAEFFPFEARQGFDGRLPAINW